MKFKIDENLPIEVAEILRRSGHDAKTAIEQSLGGGYDRAIASACSREGRVLITLDSDFSDIRAYPPEKHAGIIVLRLRRQDKPHIMETMEHLIEVFSTENPDRHLWIVNENRIRIRQ